MAYYAAERKKELLPFVAAWMELESIMLSEISQMVRDKYHDLAFNWNIINRKKKRKQNITRDIEVKNNLTITRGSGEETVRRGDYRNYYKGHMDKTKGEGGSRGGK